MVNIASRIKGITVEIGGETTGLEAALSDVMKSSNKMAAELRDVEKLLKFDPENIELLRQKQELLTAQIGNTEQKLQQLKDAQEQVNSAFEAGEMTPEAYRAFNREIQATEGYLANLQGKLEALDDTNAPEKAADDIEEIEKEANKATAALGALGRGAGTAAKGLTAMAAAGAAGIGALVGETSELSMILARLRFNAANEGFNTSGVEEGFKKITAVSGDAGAATEAMANLMQTGFSDNQLAQAVDLVNGAYLRFSDTLSTEGVADGIQETFGTGVAAGSFAELLERAGVNLDTFNAGLATASKNGTETDYVLQAMSDIGLAGTAEAFAKANPEIMAQQEAMVNLQMALSALGVALTPLVTIVTNFLAKIAEWTVANVDLTGSFESIATGIVALLPSLFSSGLKLISTVVQAIVENLPMIISTGMQILMTLITGIIQMLPTLVNQINTLLPLISQILQQNLPMIIKAGIQLLIALIKGIISILPQLIRLAIDLIVIISEELLKHLPEIIDAGVELIFALIDGIVDCIPELSNAIFFKVIPAIFKALKEVKLNKIGENIMQGLINGIKNMAENVYRAAKDVANGIGKKIASILELGSPSRVMIDMGKDTGKGLAIGLDNSINKIQQAAGNMGNSVVDALVGMLGGGDVVQKYFQAIQEDGDWLNDWLTHMPKDVANLAKQIGFILSPELEGTNVSTPTGKNMNMNVTINSPKQLNAREANVVWNQTMKKMQLQW